jgi:hypothetical protein
LFNDSACGRKEFATEARKNRKYSASGRKCLAIEAQKRDLYFFLCFRASVAIIIFAAGKL